VNILANTDPKRLELRPGQPTMKAVVTTGHGGFDRLDYRDVPIPEPGPGEVLLRVLAASVNNTDINTRLGWYSSSPEGFAAPLARLPPGTELAVIVTRWGGAPPHTVRRSVRMLPA